MAAAPPSGASSFESVTLPTLLHYRLSDQALSTLLHYLPAPVGI